jgi:hypothetical protein
MTQASTPVVRRRWPVLVAGLLAAALAAGLLVKWAPWRGESADPPPEARSFPPPPVSPSPYLNTGRDAHYVGSETCRSCHEDRHESFRTTGMGRSMAEVDLAQEPPDGSFDHAPSRRRYQVVRKDGQLWHREFLLTDGPPDVLLCEYPVKYEVGSGSHSRTYLVETDGFLVESPVTWFASRKAWGMSPGYDAPAHLDFQRPVGEGCLICHAGQAEARDGSLHRMHITEMAIGCERCHGPGSLHVERHKGRERPAPKSGGTDFTIVNPADLSRELSEAVCQQCHLQSAAVITTRGRTLTDFRPGLPLEDFRQDYDLEAGDKSMKIVGHVAQMHRSRCYQGSETLTCLTCHDPHHEPTAKDRVEHYRSVCLTCHRPERCTVGAERRRKESPDNDCVHCHMPQVPTETPHLAFTHHRIGRHDKPADDEAAPARRGPARLRPFLEPARLGEVDRKLSLGLGWMEVADQEENMGRRGQYRRQALDLLTEVRSAGLRDPQLDLNLAYLKTDRGPPEIESFTEGRRVSPELTGSARCNALSLLAQTLVRQKRPEEAASPLRELTRLRRQEDDWVLLAFCEKALGRDGPAIEALETASRINPRAWRVHQELADHYRRQGDAQRAAWHEQRAVP